MSLPTKEGYLLKYKNKLSGWDNRYFKLEKMYFHYYETKDSPSPRKTVLRTDIISVTETNSFSDRSNCLEVGLKGFDRWYIQCKSEFELKQWASALLSHVPEGDKRRRWLDEKLAGAKEPTVPVPTMPQYMTAPPKPQDEPPSYRTAYYQAPPPVAPGYEHLYYQGGGGGGGQPGPGQQTAQGGAYGTDPYQNLR